MDEFVQQMTMLFLPNYYNIGELMKGHCRDIYGTIGALQQPINPCLL